MSSSPPREAPTEPTPRPPGQLPRRHRWWWVALAGAGIAAAVLVVLLASGDDPDPPPERAETATTVAPTTPSSEPPTPSTLDAQAATEAEVIAAYRAAVQAEIEAAAIPDPDYPGIAATHTGPMLEQWRDVLLFGLRADGRVIRYPEPSLYDPEIESIEFRGDEVAVLTVCVVDDGERYVVATNELVSDGVPNTVLGEEALQRVDGVWRLAERVPLQEWEGVGGCAVD